MMLCVHNADDTFWYDFGDALCTFGADLFMVTLVIPCLLGAGDMFQYDIRGALCTG